MTRATAILTRTFRVVPPRWAHLPLSGEGAAWSGGRFNAPGTPAFYSALDPHTAYAEYTNALYDRPGLLCTFKVAHAKVADLRDGRFLKDHDIAGAELVGAWLGVADAPTQLIGSRLIALGFDGALYHSLQHPAGTNLVMWHWNGGGRANIRLLDRFGEAPLQPLA